ncbi:MAG: pantoate--beta-alanine ligase, partial [Gemmatimonadaceae bacterium]|nr:pantoate--beta-alanine ligase [Gemmatimonadaceae bacterium]
MSAPLVVRDVATLRAAVGAARARGERVAFVPTMGALHEGHLRLLDRARGHGACVVLSIFVNPLQFAPTEDLARYPRTEAADIAAAATRGCTIAFVPPVDVMYPGARAVGVVPEALASRWEGAIRPGHFAGVLTVVTKLFHMVQPDVAVFGQKDLQQAALVQALVRDLDFPVTIDVAPIVREGDGLAMSSRNRYLAPAERARAGALPRALADVVTAFESGARAAHALLRGATLRLEAEADVRIDYLAVVDGATLEPVVTASIGDFVILAARVGATRLLDNHRLGDPFPLPP